MPSKKKAKHVCKLCQRKTLKNKNKLFLLKGIGETYVLDFFDSFMIIASSSQEARQLAQDKTWGNETIDKKGNDRPYWTDPKMSSCQIIRVNKHKPGIVISSFNAG